MTRRVRVVAGWHIVVLALLGMGGAALTDAQAQGLVTMQKLSAPLANQLVATRSRSVRRRGIR